MDTRDKAGRHNWYWCIKQFETISNIRNLYALKKSIFSTTSNCSLYISFKLGEDLVRESVFVGGVECGGSVGGRQMFGYKHRNL